MKEVILGIDLQYDFCNPEGSLFVNNADRDVQNINNFILKKIDEIDAIIMSMDSHQPIHIAHSIYWTNDRGDKPKPFDVISKTDVEKGIWIPKYNKELAIDYLKKLEDSGDICTIWPPHCIIGTRGWSIDETVFDAVEKWSIANGQPYELVNKGMFQATEHYSIFKAAVEYSSIQETLFNNALVERLDLFDKIYIVGEAADFCVANSLNDLLLKAPQIAPRIFMLTDCMSYIIPENPKAVNIFEKAKNLGVNFCLSTDI